MIGSLLYVRVSGFDFLPVLKGKTDPFNSFSQQIYTPEMIDALEKELLSVNDCPTVI